MVPAPSSNDLRRRDRIVRYKPYVPKEGEDPMAEYMNLLAMLFSMCGLMMRFKWAAWAAVSLFMETQLCHFCKYRTFFLSFIPQVD